MWNCVQVEDDDRIRRKIIFNQVQSNPQLLSDDRKIDINLSDSQQNIQYGSTVYYCDNCEVDESKRIKEARFVGSSSSLNLTTPREIILKLLNTEYELLQFCREHQLKAESTIEQTVEAYEFIKLKLEETKKNDHQEVLVQGTEEQTAVEQTETSVEEQASEPVQTEVVQQSDETKEMTEEVTEEHIQIQVPLQPGQVQQSPPQAIIQQPQQFLQSPQQQLFMHNQQLYAIVPSNAGNGGISRGIPLQIAKQDKQGETRAFRNGVQNIQITDGGQQYEIIQKTEDVDHEETQQVVQMEETQFEERVTWGDDGTGHAGTIQAPNLEVMREETIEADQTEQQTNGQQEATIAVSSSGVHQTIGAYGNQLTPTTLLLSTNHLGQTQVFPLSTIPNDPWSGQNVQQIMYPVTTVINQGDTGQIAKITSPNGQTMATSPTTKQSTRYTANQVKRTPAKRSSTGGGSARKKRTWKSLVLPPEKIPISPHGTWEKPVLERIAPGQNYKDMRTWVFYLSVHGKLFKAVVEKILHEKKTAYLTCSNAKKKALQEKCKWRGRLYMRDPLVNPDTDEFADLNNWSVVEVKNYHKHRHDNCYVEGIKHYNTQNAKRCRVQRGQVIAVHDGVVKDISKMPPEEQERILALSTQSDRPSQLTVHQMRDLKRKTQQHQQLEESEFRSNSESDQIQLVVTTLPEQQEITLEQSTMVEGQSENRLELTEEVVEEEGIVDQQAVQRETVNNETEFELTSVDLKTETHQAEDEDVPPLENGQEEMDGK